MFDSPGFSGSRHGVEDDQELPGACDERELRWLAAFTQAHVEGMQNGMVSRSDDCCHVERAAHRGATADEGMHLTVACGSRR
jgi:hypothetical protein